MLFFVTECNIFTKYPYLSLINGTYTEIKAQVVDGLDDIKQVVLKGFSFHCYTF